MLHLGRSDGRVAAAQASDAESGTNEFHRDAFEYSRDKVLNRDNTFDKQAEQTQRTGKKPFLRNQWGGDIGGPIIKNRLHFYTASSGRKPIKL